LDLLTTYRSWLQISITLSLISTLCKLLHAKSSPAFSVFTRRFLVSDLTVEIFQLHSLKSSLHRLPYRTDLVAPVVFSITPRHRPRRKHCSSIVVETCLSRRCVVKIAARTTGNTASNSFSIVACWFVAVGTCFFLRSLPSNKSTHYNMLPS
jgi:hypothetical protein